MDDHPTEIRFHEVQRLPWWVRAVVLALAGLIWWSFVQQIVLGRPWGSKPAPDALVWVLLIGLGVGVPGLLLAMRLATTVDDQAVRVRWWPFPGRTFALQDIRGCEAVTYRPLRDYGGWGLRWSPGRGWCFNASGNRGVRLQLPRGKSFLIGSQGAEALADAIHARRRVG